MTRKGEAHETLSLLFHCDGVPPTMVLHGSKEQCKGDFKRKLCEADCHARQTEPYSPRRQAAEGCIRKLKRGVSRKMIKTGSPRVLWDHCIELEALIRSSTSNTVYMTNVKVPKTIMTSSTAKISHICEFGWYDWVMFQDNVPTFPDLKLILGQYLGSTTNVGSALTAKILKSNGQTVCRSALQHLIDEEIYCSIHQEMRRVFDETIANLLGSNATDQDFPAEDLTPDFDFNDDEHDLDPVHGDLEVTPEMGDNYLNAEISVPRGGILMKGRITSWKRDSNGNPIGLANANPILDMREYTFTFDNGDKTVLSANLIAEAMYAQCDPDRNQYVLLDSIIDHIQLDSALRPSDQKVVRPDGCTYLKRSTVGWQVYCQWKDGSTSWESLADLKVSHPIETAEYAVTKGLDHETAFNWWVPHVLKKRDQIISLVCKRTTHFLKRTHKFGIEIPKTVKEALALERKNGNTLLADAIAKKMREVRIAFNVLPDGHPAPIGYQKIPCHVIF
jgi:hypothetical protein